MAFYLCYTYIVLTLLKNKLVLTWEAFSTFAKLFFIFILGLSIIITTANATIFTVYYNQLNRTVLKEVERDMKLHTLGLQRRAETAGSTVLNLGRLISLAHTDNDFEEIVKDNLQAVLEGYTLPRQIAYYSLEDNEVISVSRDYSEQSSYFDTYRIDELLSVTNGRVVVFPVDRANGNLYVGTPVYDKYNKIIGAVILTGNFSQIFEEIEDAANQTAAMRAVALKNGDYIWRHKNFKNAYPDGKNIMQDFSDIPGSFLKNDTDIMMYDSLVIAYSTVTVPYSEFEAIIFQVLKFDPLSHTIHTLRSTLFGITFGYLGVLGLILIFIARLIGVEIKFRETALKEDEDTFTIAEKKRWKILDKLSRNNK